MNPDLPQFHVTIAVDEYGSSAVRSAIDAVVVADIQQNNLIFADIQDEHDAV